MSTKFKHGDRVCYADEPTRTGVVKELPGDKPSYFGDGETCMVPQATNVEGPAHMSPGIPEGTMMVNWGNGLSSLVREDEVVSAPRVN